MSKNVRDDQTSIQCECCISWFHFECYKLTNIGLDNLSKSSDAWYCIACLDSLLSFNFIYIYIDIYIYIYIYMRVYVCIHVCITTFSCILV